MKTIKKILSSLIIGFVCLFGLNSCGIDVDTAYEYSKQVNLEEYKTISAITFTKTVSSRSLKNPLEEGIKSRTYKVSIGQTMKDDDGDGVKEAKKDCAMKIEESYVTTESSKSHLMSSTIYTKTLNKELVDETYDYKEYIFDTHNLSEETVEEEEFYNIYDNLKKEIFSYIVLPESADVISASGSESGFSTVTMSYVSTNQSLVTYNLTINKWNKSTVLEGKYKVGKLIVDDGNTGIKTVYTWEYPEYFSSLTAYTITNAEADLKDYRKLLNKHEDETSDSIEDSSISVPTEQPSDSVESTEPESSTPEVTEDPSSPSEEESTEPSIAPSGDPSEVPSEPTSEPSIEPTPEPSVEPSVEPSEEVSSEIVSEPTEVPSE